MTSKMGLKNIPEDEYKCPPQLLGVCRKVCINMSIK